METESRYRCRCGKPWATMVAHNVVSASQDDWRICAACDGDALRTALMPIEMRRDRGSLDDA